MNNLIEFLYSECNCLTVELTEEPEDDIYEPGIIDNTGKSLKFRKNPEDGLYYVIPDD